MRDATFAGETAARRTRRLAQEAAAAAEAEAEVEAARERALEEEVERQSQQPPLTTYDWNQHVSTGLTPAVKYLFQRLKEGGDRYDLVQFYDGAKVFDPNYATKITNNDANKLIEKLGIYPKIGDGDNLLQLKKSWKACKTHSQRNISSLENDGDILSWHYAVYLGLDKEMEVDRKKTNVGIAVMKMVVVSVIKTYVFGLRWHVWWH